MKKGIFASFVLALACLFGQVSAHAETLDLSGLTPAQVEALKMQANASRASGTTPAEPNKEVLQAMDRAAEVARVLGSGLAATARELGVAVNEFAQTGTGRIVTAVLLWRYIGRDALGVVIGSVVLFGGIALGMALLRRGTLSQRRIEYGTAPVLWGLFHRRIVLKNEVDYNEGSTTESQAVMQFAAYVIIVFSVILGLNCIF